MQILESTIHIGLPKPVSVVHASDTHLTLADTRDDQRKIDLAKARLPIFPTAEDDLSFLSDFATAKGLPILHTGDLIDFVSAANLDAAKDFAANNDLFFAAGNHEFSLYVGEAKEDAAYRNQSLAKVQACFTNDIRFASRVIGGINFVAIDNGYYLFEENQLTALKAEVAKGLPIVLLMHNPLYEDSLYDFHIKLLPGAPTYLVSVPEEKMAYYTPDRYAQQKEDAVTHEMTEYITNEPAIRALLTGHLHFNYESALPTGKMQLVTGLSTLRHIVFE